MLNILLIDNCFFHSKIIEDDSIKYFNEIDIKCNFLYSSDLDAITILKNNNIDIVFIDISSKDFDGIELLKEIKNLELQQSPKFIAVTILYDNKYRQQALKLKVYRYIYKPYDYQEIAEVLSKTFNKNYYSNEKNRTLDFINIDDLNKKNSDFEEEDEFIDFEEEKENEENNLEHSKELMDKYNESHKNITAKTFLAEYDEFGIDMEELFDLEDEIDSLIANILFNDNIEIEMVNIIYMLEKYNRFLYSFSEFEELNKVLVGLIKLLENIDFIKLKKTILVTKFIIAIIQDLIDWKDHVFIKKDAVDIFYINASILNSFIQLKDVINR
jgi:response regulator RpfG family c-di-GMP phosphodiesterase